MRIEFIDEKRITHKDTKTEDKRSSPKVKAKEKQPRLPIALKIHKGHPPPQK